MESMLAVQIIFAVGFIYLSIQTFMLLNVNLKGKYGQLNQTPDIMKEQGEGQTVAIVSTLLGWIISITGYYFTITPYSFFKKLNIPTLKPDPILGNVRAMAAVGFNDFMLDNIKKFGDIFGVYIGRRPILCVADTDLLRQIMVKDFDKFPNRAQIINHFKKPLDKGLVFIRDETQWRTIRSVAGPTFTTGKLKQTVPLICECLKPLENKFAAAAAAKKSLNIWSAFGTFTSNVIISSAFGKSPNQYSADEMAAFNKKMVEVFSFKALIGIVDFLNSPESLRNIVLNNLGGHDVTYFLNVLKPVIEERRNTGNASRKDFLDLILAENESGITKLTDDEIMAQSITFLLAGYETTMNAIAFSTYLLALNPDVQEKLYNEVKDQDFGVGQSVYDNVQKLKYLDQVFSEVLRCYPPAYFVMREAIEDFFFKGIKIPKGTEIMIPIHAIHHHPLLWTDPEKFDPERFSPGEKAKIKPCAYIPFGYGPRICIGMRFSQLEAKIALVHLVRKFRFDKSVDTEIPLSVSLRLTMAAEHGIFLKVTARG